MHDFKEYLMKKFGKSVREISSTEFENELINNDFKMICWDDVATYFNKTNGEFKGEFSTADGLYILEKEDKIQLFFFEFKNVNYSDDADRQMSIFHLKNILEQMKECDKGCRLHESIDMILNHLVDASYVSLRSKPSDSLSLFYYMLKEYYGVEDDDRGLLELLFRTEKFFFLVSNTPSEYLPFKNKSNRKSTIVEPLSFLKRFEPYHYNNVYAIYKTGFEKYFYNHNKEYFN